MHGKQVAIEDADILHAHAPYTQQVVGAWVEEFRIDPAGILDILLGENRRTRSDAADDRQFAFVRGVGLEARDADAA
ncbi:hypothetical protein D3C81_2102170 [compost metagenome]